MIDQAILRSGDRLHLRWCYRTYRMFLRWCDTPALSWDEWLKTPQAEQDLREWEELCRARLRRLSPP